MAPELIKSALAKGLTLNQTLAELGFTVASSRRLYSKDISLDGEVIATLDAHECWGWINDGCIDQSEAAGALS
jgi:hypothetical protein